VTCTTLVWDSAQRFEKGGVRRFAQRVDLGPRGEPTCAARGA